MEPTRFRTAVGAALTLAVSAVLLPASAASAAGHEAAAPTGGATEARTVNSVTVDAFGRIADAVLTDRTAALLDAKPTRRIAPLGNKQTRLTAGLARSEKSALSSLRSRKARLAALGEAYTSADTRTTVDKVRVKDGRATVQVTETTTLRYKKVRGDEPATTGFQAHHELSFAARPGGTWELTGMKAKEDGLTAVNAPTTTVATTAGVLPKATPASTSWPAPAKPKRQLPDGYNYKAMAAYAEKYWRNYNPAYRKFNDAGGDCTNFISQALKAGGWKHDSGMYDDYRNWWYDARYQTNSWVGADDWSWFALHSKRATNLANVYQMGLGDILQLDFDRNGSKDHSMITTYRSWSGVPYLTYHQTNTYRKSVASIIATNPRALYYAYRT
ncbi:amidase domain-containing protein [Streptomyces sp. LX-29]|uniref:amidase domain-containing protein n=1 Tax=Streptomyces sp. LX-29 TaxID=2900152 RepID=UPI00240DA4D4|nr:amidase domain-containing protein [Streptomyces sp. LX-29]WFB10662.1 amidase domain-containing protein [Streptomyces sp. LX-29]